MPLFRTRKNSLRLPGYDYTWPGFYFVTISTKHNTHLFGYVKHGQMRLNDAGDIVWQCWLDLPRHYRCILDAAVVMPNHFHGILIIPDSIDDIMSPTRTPSSFFSLSSPASRVRADLKSARTAGARADAGIKEGVRVGRQHSLSEIIRGFKTFSTRRMNEYDRLSGRKIWHRGFYEHILRGVADVEMVRQYIRDNPQRWPSSGHGMM